MNNQVSQFIMDNQAPLSASSTQIRHVMFAVEIAVQLPGDPAVTNHTPEWRKHLNPVKNALNSAGVPGLKIGAKNVNDFTAWSITENRVSESCFDIVSAKVHFDNRSFWAPKLLTIYQILRNRGCRIMTGHGNKVHVTTEPELSLADQKAIARTIIQYTGGFNTFAWDVWGNHKAVSVPFMIWVPQKPEQLVSKVDSARLSYDIAKLMNTAGLKGHARVWNFWPLAPPLDGAQYYEGYRFTNMLEYNLTPQCHDINNLRLYINLVCLFVSGALNHNRGSGLENDLLLSSEEAKIKLMQFILGQAKKTPMSELEEYQLHVLATEYEGE